MLFVKGLVKFPKVLYLRKRIINLYSDLKNENNELEIQSDVLNNFLKTFLKYIWFELDRAQIAISFFNSEIHLVKKVFKICDVKEFDPIVIWIIKNDLERIEIFLDHHRKLGVKHFVIVDNLADDGTFEYLRTQSDINLYRCSTPYTTLNRESWINRIIANYGFNQWYLCLDSDELFVSPNWEKITISEKIKQLTTKKIKRVRALMIDMYSSNAIFDKDFDRDLRRTHCSFDGDTYITELNYSLNLIFGGPRSRIFCETTNSFKDNLSKTPLFYMKSGILQGNSHYLFPYNENFSLPIASVLLHYKFLASDLERYQERVLATSRDGHPSFINEDTILTDTYPDKFLRQTLFAIDLTSKNWKVILEQKHPAAYSHDQRCDLHPSLSSSKTMFQVDILDNDRRKISIGKL